MLLEEKKVSIVTSGMKDTREFTAKLDGLMFDNLINGIYSNKIAAGIREYSTNARDGHARRGNLDQPFDVGLPTRDHAFFEVRDYGSSLTHDEVFDVYTVLGESTKRETNDETGCLGLGSKSAFAYTTSFTVTCWKDGKKRDYSCFIGENGKPTAALISEIASNEKQGLRVSYPVKIDDIGKFNQEAANQLRGFKPAPNILRCSAEFKSAEQGKLLVEGDDFEVYAAIRENYRVTANPMAIQGSVAYPINANNASLSNAIREVCKDRPSNESKIKRLLDSTNINIRFNIGEIKMTTSREELAYDDRTCQNIAKKCLEVLGKIQDKLDETYKNCKTLREARIKMASLESGRGMDIDAILNINERFWNGTLIDPDVRVKTTWCPVKEIWYTAEETRVKNKTTGRMEVKDENRVDNAEIRLIQEYNYRNKFGEIKAQFQWPSISNYNSTAEFSRPTDNPYSVYVVEVEDKMEGLNKNNKFRNIWKNVLNRTDSRFVWVKVDSKANWEKLKETMFLNDDCKVHFLHNQLDLKMPKRGIKSTATGTNECSLRVLKSYYVSSPFSYENVDLAKVTEKMPVMFYSKQKYFMCYKDMVEEKNEMSRDSLVESLKRWNNYFSMPKIYVVNNQTKKIYENNKSKFVEYDKFRVEYWKKHIPKDWEKKYVESVNKVDTSTEDKYGRKLWSLRQKGIKVKGTSSKLENAPDNRYKNGYSHVSIQRFTMPHDAEVHLKSEIEAALKKYAHLTQKDETFKNVIESDTILEFLISNYDHYSSSKLEKVIKIRLNELNLLA